MRNTLQKAPGVFLGTPDDSNSAESKSLIDYEDQSIKATYEGNKEKAMMAGGEVAQRINDMPKVEELVQTVMKEAEEILANLPKKFL
jgi:enoyl-[acyl-carrier protein] reductase II